MIPGVGPVLAVLGGVRRFIAALLGPMWRWVTADIRNVLLAVLAAIVAAHWFMLDPNLRSEREAAMAERDQAIRDYDAEKNAHLATIANHENAARAAEALQAGNLRRVEAEQGQISERIVDDYEARLADLRGLADRLAGQLRKSAAETGPRLSSGLPVPGTGDATDPADRTPPADGLPAAGQCPPMNLAERLVATEQALQLDALIDWTLEQASVRPNP